MSSAIIADIQDTFEVKFVSESQVTKRLFASFCNGGIICKLRHRECTF